MLGLACPVVHIFVEFEQEIRPRRLSPPVATQFPMSPIIGRYMNLLPMFPCHLAHKLTPPLATRPSMNPIRGRYMDLLPMFPTHKLTTLAMVNGGDL